MEPRPRKHSGENIYESQLERFMPSAQMDSLVKAALIGSGRMDENGRALPIKVRRYKELEGYLLSSEGRADPTYRDDIFVPSPEMERMYWTIEDGRSYCNTIEDPDFDSGLYNQLTGRGAVELSDEQIMDNKQQREAFEVAAGTRYSAVLSRHQMVPAYHVESRTLTENKVFEDTRVYVSGGIQGLKIATCVIEKGAEFSYAKIWTQYDTTHSQEVRRDTPIFLVNNYHQLESVIRALREIPLPEQEVVPFAGYPVPGLPGVYIGQVRDGQAFNGVMGEVFGNAIKSVCYEQNIKAGDHITQEIIHNISFQARLLARNACATKYGISADNHAFIDGQPMDQIIQTVSSGAGRRLGGSALNASQRRRDT